MPAAPTAAAPPDAPRTYPEAALSAATNGFSAAAKLDEGAFGAVFKGVLAGGLTVAIKVLKPEAAAAAARVSDPKHAQYVGDAALLAAYLLVLSRCFLLNLTHITTHSLLYLLQRTTTTATRYVGAGGFRKELDVLTQYQHPNIVCLLGHCLSDASGGGGGVGGGGGDDAAAQPQPPPQQPPRQCLVFEFMAGGSLNARLLEGRRLGEGEGKRLAAAAAAQPLTAEERFGIASDVARGLAYLHTAYLHREALPTPLIHQDVKSDNILLAEVGGQLVAKVADFGTARYAPSLQEQGQRSLGQTHHSTKAVVGTTPYMPMEVSLGLRPLLASPCMALLRNRTAPLTTPYPPTHPPTTRYPSTHYPPLTTRSTTRWGTSPRRRTPSPSAWCCASC